MCDRERSFITLHLRLFVSEFSVLSVSAGAQLTRDFWALFGTGRDTVRAGSPARRSQQVAQRRESMKD